MFSNTQIFSGSWRAIASILIITAIGYFTQTYYWGTNLDTSWLVLAAERMLSGSILYVDLLEPNPPFSVWAYIPAVYIAKLTGIDLLTACTIYVLALCLVGVALTGLILAKGGVLESKNITKFMIANAVLAVILSGNCFAQREHIGAILFTPIIALTCWRINNTRPVTWPYWLAAGIAASVLLLIKPHYVVLFLFLGGLAAIKKRNILSLFQPEYFVSVILLFSYVVAAYRIHPIYFNTTIKMVAEIYLPYHLGLAGTFVEMAPWLVTLGIYAKYQHEQSSARSADSSLGFESPNISRIFMMAALCAWIPYFIQRKGFTYHGFVATYFSMLAVALFMLDRLKSSRDLFKGQTLLTTPIISLLGIFITAFPAQLMTFKPDDTLVQNLKSNYAGKTYSVIGNHLPAFPLVMMADGNWLNQDLGDWKAIATHYIANEAAQDGDMAKYTHYNDFFINYLREKKRWWLSAKPQIMVFQKDDPFLAYIRKNCGFEEVMDKYTPLAAAGDIVVYTLKN